MAVTLYRQVGKGKARRYQKVNAQRLRIRAVWAPCKNNRPRLISSAMALQNVHPKELLTLSPFRFALNGGLLSKLSKREKSV